MKPISTGNTSPDRTQYSSSSNNNLLASTSLYGFTMLSTNLIDKDLEHLIHYGTLDEITTKLNKYDDKCLEDMKTQLNPNGKNYTNVISIINKTLSSRSNQTKNSNFGPLAPITFNPERLKTKNMKFDQFLKLIHKAGFMKERTKGDHNILKHPLDKTLHLNIQKDGGNTAKNYQLKQFKKQIKQFFEKIEQITSDNPQLPELQDASVPLTVVATKPLLVINNPKTEARIDKSESLSVPLAISATNDIAPEKLEEIPISTPITPEIPSTILSNTTIKQQTSIDKLINNFFVIAEEIIKNMDQNDKIETCKTLSIYIIGVYFFLATKNIDTNKIWPRVKQLLLKLSPENLDACNSAFSTSDVIHSNYLVYQGNFVDFLIKVHKNQSSKAYVMLIQLWLSLPDDDRTIRPRILGYLSENPNTPIEKLYLSRILDKKPEKWLKLITQAVKEKIIITTRDEAELVYVCGIAVFDHTNELTLRKISYTLFDVALEFVNTISTEDQSDKKLLAKIHNRLGLYYEGDNLSEAFKHYKKSSNLGNSEASYNIIAQYLDKFIQEFRSGKITKINPQFKLDLEDMISYIERYGRYDGTIFTLLEGQLVPYLKVMGGNIYADKIVNIINTIKSSNTQHKYIEFDNDMIDSALFAFIPPYIDEFNIRKNFNRTIESKLEKQLIQNLFRIFDKYLTKVEFNPSNVKTLFDIWIKPDIKQETDERDKQITYTSAIYKLKYLMTKTDLNVQARSYYYSILSDWYKECGDLDNAIIQCKFALECLEKQPNAIPLVITGMQKKLASLQRKSTDIFG